MWQISQWGLQYILFHSSKKPFWVVCIKGNVGRHRRLVISMLLMHCPHAVYELRTHTGQVWICKHVPMYTLLSRTLVSQLWIGAKVSGDSGAGSRLSERYATVLWRSKVDSVCTDFAIKQAESSKAQSALDHCTENLINWTKLCVSTQNTIETCPIEIGLIDNFRCSFSDLVVLKLFWGERFYSIANVTPSYCLRSTVNILYYTSKTIILSAI